MSEARSKTTNPHFLRAMRKRQTIQLGEELKMNVEKADESSQWPEWLDYQWAQFTDRLEGYHEIDVDSFTNDPWFLKATTAEIVEQFINLVKDPNHKMPFSQFETDQ
jgi:hypothetical protein